MKTHADQQNGSKNQAVANNTSKQHSTVESIDNFAANPGTTSQQQLRESIHTSPQTSQLRAYQEMANNSPQVNQLRIYQAMADSSHLLEKKESLCGMHGYQDSPAKNDSSILQRKINLETSEDNKKEDAQLEHVLDFLRTYDEQHNTTYYATIKDDYGFKEGLKILITAEATTTYKLAQAQDLMVAIRQKAAMTHRGDSYELDKTFRGPDQAKDSVYRVKKGDETSVIKRGADLEKEARITGHLTGNENVIGLLDKEDDNKQIRLEYAAQGTLKDFNPADANAAKALIKGIINGLNYVHSKNVVHGDMGAANVFVGGTAEAPVAKIADFGESMEGHQAVLSNLAGDISGGTNLLETLAKHVNSEASVAFIVALQTLRQEALVLVEKAVRAAPHTEETLELYANLGEEAPEQGPLPTDEEIEVLRGKWLGLLTSDFLA